MDYQNKNNNHLTTDAPDDLYEKCISVVAGLPDDATKWYLPLCNTYYSVFAVPL